jgi:hypothetical protein
MKTQVQVEFSLVLFIYSDYCVFDSIFLGMKYHETFPFVTQDFVQVIFRQSTHDMEQIQKIFVTRFQRWSPYWMDTVYARILSTLEFCIHIREHTFPKVLNFVIVILWFIAFL